MGVLDTTIDPRAQSYLDSRTAMLTALAELEVALDAAREGGGERAVTRHHARGKLLARERVELLVDRDSPLLELSPVAGWDTDTPVGAGVVTAIGVVEDRLCVIAASDPTVRGGAVGTGTLQKIQRAQQIAAENRLPMICLLEATGVEPAERAEVLLRTGQVVAGFTRLTMAGIPTAGAFFGDSTTVGDADLAESFDYLVALRPRATARPADHLGEDERDALRLTRQCVLRFPDPARGMAGAELSLRSYAGRLARSEPSLRSYAGRLARSEPSPPTHDPEDLLAVPVTEPWETLARILDGSALDEVQPGYGTGLCTGWGTLHGHPVAVLANTSGSTGSAESDKAARFVARAEAAGTPLLFLAHGAAPAARTGAVLTQAVAGATVPLLSVRVGTWHGLSVVSSQARFRFAWPTAATGAIDAGAAAAAGAASGAASGAAAAARSAAARSAAARSAAARSTSGATADAAASRAATAAEAAAAGPGAAAAGAAGAAGAAAAGAAGAAAAGTGAAGTGAAGTGAGSAAAASRAAVAAGNGSGAGQAPAAPALYPSGRLDDDGVIDPRDTRTVLGFCLAIVRRGGS